MATFPVVLALGSVVVAAFLSVVLAAVLGSSAGSSSSVTVGAAATTGFLPAGAGPVLAGVLVFLPATTGGAFLGGLGR